MATVQCLASLYGHASVRASTISVTQLMPMERERHTVHTLHLVTTRGHVDVVH